MEKRGVPPNYMTRIKTEQYNLKKILLASIIFKKKTSLCPSIVFLVDSIVLLVTLFLLFSKTDLFIGYLELGIDP